ncbi:unnamed protein product [Vitrella brassicaformis CCMP3155]|uniref:Uncharacterized protein n=1 Tax=Vitrella brassicaformis (strain CCMP3155) TaxID=1169540 RepID=A0A0G4FTQ2_VITBC|nr:unnamed protein product [Vitrella brassicaformis CCMP3155]|eukprot:CEM18321.1 unnamed protein product [Vitrella brassicaformis CCMP3155]
MDDIARSVIEALRVSGQPNVSHADRVAAEQQCTALYEHPNACGIADRLVTHDGWQLDAVLVHQVRCFGYTLFREAIRKQWQKWITEQKNTRELKEKLLSYLQLPAGHFTSPSVQQACASALSEVALREFPQGWPEMLPSLLRAGRTSAAHASIVLRVIRELAQQRNRLQEIVSGLSQAHDDIVTTIEEYLSSHGQAVLMLGREVIRDVSVAGSKSDGNSAGQQLPSAASRPAFAERAIQSFTAAVEDAGRALAAKQRVLDELQSAKQQLLSESGWQETAVGRADERLHLSVGGAPYEVSRGWLTKKADSLLAFIFSGHIDGRLVRCHDDSNRIFLDLDNLIFDKIIHALSTYDGSSSSSSGAPDVDEALFVDMLLNKPLPTVNPSPGPPPPHMHAPVLPRQMHYAVPSHAAVMEAVKSLSIGYAKEHAAIDAQTDAVKSVTQELRERLRLAEPWLQPSTGVGVEVRSLRVIGMTLSTTTATVEACGGDNSQFANRFDGGSLDATSPAIVRKVINFARRHRLTPSQSLTISPPQHSSATEADTHELRRTLEMFGLCGPREDCVQRIAPSMPLGGGAEMGLLGGRSQMNRLVMWLEEESKKPAEDIQCTYSCCSSGVYDGAAFLASIPPPEEQKGWVVLLQKSGEVLGAASPEGLNTCTPGLNDSYEHVYDRSLTQAAIPFLFKLIDVEGGTVSKMTAQQSTISVSRVSYGEFKISVRPQSRGHNVSHTLCVRQALPFDSDALLAISGTERPFLSGPSSTVDGRTHFVRGGWDAIEVWQVT